MFDPFHYRVPFPSASEDVSRAKRGLETKQTKAEAYRLAFADQDFLTRDELRPLRLSLELLKPDLLLAEHRVASTLVIFGSSRTRSPEKANGAGENPIFDEDRAYAEARDLSERVTRAGQGLAGDEREFVIVTGGGPGIMEAANRGAEEAGGESIGLNIVLPHEQAPNRYITPDLCFQFHYFAIRKMHFLMRAKAVVGFPGGFGTLDELFETLTLIQTKKMEPVPILLFDKSFWTKVVDFDAMVAAGVISKRDLELFDYVESADEAWARICGYYNICPASAKPLES
ncbi:MAG: TIGR00730 family Rossman fold protein [Geminicoccaceae bacterium]